MIRRLIKVILARKRGSDDHWRRLYERERREWRDERRWLLSQIAVKNGAAPMTGPQPEYKAEPVLTEEEQEEMAIAEQARVLAANASLDDFDLEVAKLNATRDPLWRPIVDQAEKMRRGESVS